MTDLSQLTNRVIEMAKDVGDFIRHESTRFDSKSIEYKGLNDLVSYVDKQAERKIVNVLSHLLPEAGFITEESTLKTKGEVYQWIIDPLDGTTNFIYGIPTYAISIALQQEDQLVLGVVYEIGRDECFYAWKDGGAYLNGKPIKVSETNKLGKSLLTTGFPYYNFDQLEKYINVFRELTQKCHGLRRIGSAAVDLAYTACGRFDGYYEYNINLYDIAAGLVLVEEAGGETINFSGKKEFISSREVIATNGKITDELHSFINKYFY